ncbi:hypothetical protein BU17DRAFT_40092 [Hysterangium stoloniferum]|nr:hypothetical protein BU17DRAFT_40092 [Hysterangium stoloniferum]
MSAILLRPHGTSSVRWTSVLALITVLILLFWSLPRQPLLDYYTKSQILAIPSHSSLIAATQSAVPLSYDDIYAYEQNLPQNNDSLPFPEGQNGRMVKFSTELFGYGLNNQLQDRMLHSLLAFLSNRAYVFTDVTFNYDPNTIADWHPLNTFISGPTAGGSFPPALAAARVPRAITQAFWESVCPPERRRYVDGSVVNMEKRLSRQSEALDVVEGWVTTLRELKEPCVEVMSGSPVIFDFILMNSPKVLSLYPLFSSTPIVTSFRWSQNVVNVVTKNLPTITGLSPSDLVSRSSPESSEFPYDLSTTLALHLRRGDFEDHCFNVAREGWSYTGWNQLALMPDKYQVPGARSLTSGPELEEFLGHCWPSIEEIVEKVRKVKVEYESRISETSGREHLRAVYILSNAKKEWIELLKDALMKSGMVWDNVAGSRDLAFEPSSGSIPSPEKLAAQAVDMAIAARAGAFIGNGFSTMTANIVLLRLTNGLTADTSRFW